MKTITLTEAYRQVTQGDEPILRLPLRSQPAQFDNCDATVSTINRGAVDVWAFGDDKSEQVTTTTALLAHAFNTLPKVVEALRETTAWLRRIREEHESLVIEHGPDGDFNLCEAEGLLAEAESVQVPE
jgi:hypothetical protein